MMQAPWLTSILCRYKWPLLVAMSLWQRCQNHSGLSSNMCWSPCWGLSTSFSLSTLSKVVEDDTKLELDWLHVDELDYRQLMQAWQHKLITCKSGRLAKLHWQLGAVWSGACEQQQSLKKLRRVPAVWCLACVVPTCVIGKLELIQLISSFEAEEFFPSWLLQLAITADMYISKQSSDTSVQPVCAQHDVSDMLSRKLMYPMHQSLACRLWVHYKYN